MSNFTPQTRTPFHQFEVGFNIIIDLITPGTRVLDLGCGGTTALPQARLGADVLDIDIARNLVEAGNRRAGTGQLQVPGR